MSKWCKRKKEEKRDWIYGSLKRENIGRNYSFVVVFFIFYFFKFLHEIWSQFIKLVRSILAFSYIVGSILIFFFLYYGVNFDFFF